VMSNLWYLREVRAALGFSPYNRRYWHLLPAALASVMLVLGLRVSLASLRPEWLAILIGGAAGYFALVGVAALLGLDEDDRLLANAVRSRLRMGFRRSTV
jgi:hypothetical protein